MPHDAGGEGGHGEARRIVILGFFRAASALLSEIERQNQSLLDQISVVDFNPMCSARWRIAACT